MRHYEFSLSVYKMDRYKHGSSSQTYYLSIEQEGGEKQYTSCKNIIFADGLFIYQAKRMVQKIQIWNYDTHKKIGTVLLKRQNPTCNFSYQFKNFNLKLAIHSFDRCLNQEEEDMIQKGSARTLGSQRELGQAEGHQV